MSFPTWQHKFTARKRVARTADEMKYINGKEIEVEAGLHYLQGNERPYFSVTCSIYEQARNNRWMDAGGGAAHEEILKAFPKLAPVIDLHLSDDFGVPMHAVANALYWAGLSRYPDAKNVETLARHLRVSIEAAESIVVLCAESPDPREAMEFCVNELRARWLGEANHAIAVLDQLIEAQG